MRYLKRRKGIAYQRQLRRLVEAYVDSEISLDQASAAVRGWANYVRYGNTLGLRKAVLGGMVVSKGDTPESAQNFNSGLT